MQLFYSHTIAPVFALDADESRHAVRVMRLREGDEIRVTDGRGLLARCRILAADDRECTVEVVEQTLVDAAGAGLRLVVAPTKNPSRIEWLVEKAVELGCVSAIQPVECDHSERTTLKVERLEKIAVSAMKQSLQALHPAILPMLPLRQLLGAPRTSPDEQLFIAHCEADKPRVALAAALQPRRPATLLIGPEGDFSADEIALALDGGYQPVSLGPTRLRTETAALYGAMAFNIINDR